MTYGEAKVIILGKTEEKDPLRLNKGVEEAKDAEERMEKVIERFKANTDLLKLRIDLVAEIWRVLHEDFTRKEFKDLKDLSDDLVLSPRAEALVRRLDKFPWEGEYFV